MPINVVVQTLYTVQYCASRKFGISLKQATKAGQIICMCHLDSSYPFLLTSAAHSINSHIICVYLYTAC